jgi:hypothetical protein
MDPEANLATATARYRETEQAHAEARDNAIAAVVAALRAGQRPTDVTAASPFTSAYVRRIAREHGIEAPARGAAKPGTPHDA